MKSGSIIYRKDKTGKIAWITVNRPEVHNALNQAVRLELKAAIDDIAADKKLRVVVIRGSGNKAFVCGSDVNEFLEQTPMMIGERASTLGQQLFNRVAELRVPTSAMISGHCYGGGLELALCCDIRIAADNARFGQTEVNVGLIPGGGGTQRLPRLVGSGKAKNMIFTGRRIGAVEADKIGLVDRVVPLAELESEVTRLAKEIADKSPLVIDLAKKCINMDCNAGIATGLAYERANFALCFATADHKEGIKAFLKKRQPVFKGK